MATELSALPPVLKSWEHVYATNPGIAKPEALPISPLGTTYTMAQELTWLDHEHFAVGRWDGSMSIFQFTQSTTAGPVISRAVNTPSCEGVQMITNLANGAFATSNDEGSMIVWTSNGGRWMDLVIAQTLVYDTSLGVANSGVAFFSNDGTVLYFIAGHANGFVSIWQGTAAAVDLALVNTVDVRSAKPVNPWDLHNVRGIAIAPQDSQSNTYVITGSEDGDLCVIRIPDGMIISRTVYNPNAQRGINSIAIRIASDGKAYLLVANCAVGNTDKNLWLYDATNAANGTINMMDAINLQADPNLAQVFNFDVIWGAGIYWYSTTEEGLLWMGTVDFMTQPLKLQVVGNQQVTAKLGAALGSDCAGWNQIDKLALAAYDLYEFSAPG